MPINNNLFKDDDECEFKTREGMVNTNNRYNDNKRYGDNIIININNNVGEKKIEHNSNLYSLNKSEHKLKSNNNLGNKIDSDQEYLNKNHPGQQFIQKMNDNKI